MALSHNTSSLRLDVETILASLPSTASSSAPAGAARRGAMLIVMMGLPGSGKSTFARRLAPLLGAVILESDALRRRLFDIPTHDDAESARLFRAVHAATQRLLDTGRSVILDATNLREAHRRPLEDIAAKAGARLRLLHFVAPEDVILDRLARRRSALDPAEASTAYEAVFALLQTQEEPPHGVHLRIDSSDPVAVDRALRTLLAEPLTRAGLSFNGPALDPGSASPFNANNDRPAMPSGSGGLL